MSDNLPESCNATNLNWIVSYVIPAMSGLVGVLAGAWYTGYLQKQQAKLSFIEKQLKHLYSPLLGAINEITILNQIVTNISDSANTEWQEGCKEAREEARTDEGIDYESIRVNRENRIKKYAKIIDYNNQQLIDSVLPSYHHMVSIFRENYYLADPNTCEYFYTLIEFVNLWDRWLKKTIPEEVLVNLNHNENRLFIFYKEVKKIHDVLRRKLENGKA